MGLSRALGRGAGRDGPPGSPPGAPGGVGRGGIGGPVFDEQLTELVDAVYAAGDELKKNPFTDTFIIYKKRLSRFMQFVVQNAYELEVRERRKGTKRQQLIKLRCSY